MPEDAGGQLPPEDPSAGPVTEQPRCSARGCRNVATVELQWRNPALHDAARVKVWHACAEHADHLADFLGRRGFLQARVAVAPVEPPGSPDAESPRPDRPAGNRWVGVTVDCRDPARLASFWSALLETPVSQEHEGPDWATVGSRLGPQPRLTFQRVAEPKSGKVRLHIDVEVDDIDAGREQVERLGGSWTGERHDYDEGVVVIMRDPEQHEFCLVQYFD